MSIFNAARKWFTKSLGASILSLVSAIKPPKIQQRPLRVGESHPDFAPRWYRNGGLSRYYVHYFANDKRTQLQGNHLLRALVARSTSLNLPKGNANA